MSEVVGALIEQAYSPLGKHHFQQTQSILGRSGFS
jgi:hypothetical protein